MNINIIKNFIEKIYRQYNTETHCIYEFFGFIKFKFNLKLNKNLVIIHTKDGRIEYNKQIDGLKIHFNGNNSIIEIFEPTNFKNCDFSISDNCYIKIGQTGRFIHNLRITMSSNNKIEIGKHLGLNGAYISMHDEENLSVKIGDKCLFSSGIIIRPSDGHCIYDKDTKYPINIPKSGIIIGNNVWVGAEVIFLKDTIVSDNSIVGIKSIVTKTFTDSNLLLAGVPAKIIKTNIGWDVRNTQKYLNEIYNTTYVEEKKHNV